MSFLSCHLIRRNILRTVGLRLLPTHCYTKFRAFVEIAKNRTLFVHFLITDICSSSALQRCHSTTSVLLDTDGTKCSGSSICVMWDTDSMCSSMDSSFIVHIPSKESVSLLNLDRSRKRDSSQGWKPLSVCGINSFQNYERNIKVWIIFQGVLLFVRVELSNRLSFGGSGNESGTTHSQGECVAEARYLFYERLWGISEKRGKTLQFHEIL